MPRYKLFHQQNRQTNGQTRSNRAMIITNSINSIPLQRVLQWRKSTAITRMGGRWCVPSTVCRRGRNKISRIDEKRERERERCKSNFAWRSLGVYAATTRMIHRAWKSPRPSSGTAAGSGGGGGSLHSSSTSPPPASRRSSIRGAPPLPRTFQWRHWSLGTPSPSRQDSTTPLWNLVLLRRVYSNRDAPCAFPMNSQRLMEGGFLGGRDDSIIVLYSLYIYVSFVLILQHRLLILVKFIGIRESIRFHVGCKLCVAKSEGMRV